MPWRLWFCCLAGLIGAASVSLPRYLKQSSLEAVFGFPWSVRRISVTEN
jgi:hypothetical protein